MHKRGHIVYDTVLNKPQTCKSKFVACLFLCSGKVSGKIAFLPLYLSAEQPTWQACVTCGHCTGRTLKGPLSVPCLTSCAENPFHQNV